MGGSIGHFGTVRMQPELRYVLASLFATVLYQPEVQISNVQEKIDAEGTVTDEATKKKIKELVDKLMEASGKK